MTSGLQTLRGTMTTICNCNTRGGGWISRTGFWYVVLYAQCGIVRTTSTTYSGFFVVMLSHESAHDHAAGQPYDPPPIFIAESTTIRLKNIRAFITRTGFEIYYTISFGVYRYTASNGVYYTIRTMKTTLHRAFLLESARYTNKVCLPHSHSPRSHRSRSGSRHLRSHTSL